MQGPRYEGWGGASASPGPLGARTLLQAQRRAVGAGRGCAQAKGCTTSQLRSVHPPPCLWAFPGYRGGAPLPHLLAVSGGTPVSKGCGVEVPSQSLPGLSPGP